MKNLTDSLEHAVDLPLSLAIMLGFVLVMLTVTALVTNAVKDLFIRSVSPGQCSKKAEWKYPCKDARGLRAEFSVLFLQMLGFILVVVAMAIVDVCELDWFRPNLTTDSSTVNRPMVFEPLLAQWILLAYAFFHLLAIRIIFVSVFARLKIVHSTTE